MRTVLKIVGVFLLIQIGVVIGACRFGDRWGDLTPSVIAVREDGQKFEVYRMPPSGYVILTDTSTFFIRTPFRDDGRGVPFISDLGMRPKPFFGTLMWPADSDEMVIPGIVPAEDWKGEVEEMRRNARGLRETSFKDWQGRRIRVSGI